LLYKNIKINIYRTIILPVVLYGCESWSLTLREECKLRVFENRVLRRIFGPKRDEVTGEWRRLHNKKLHALYSLLNINRVIKSRRLRWAGHVACMGDSRAVYRVLVENLREGHHLEDTGIDGRIILTSILKKWDGVDEGMDWSTLAQNRDWWQAVVNAVTNLRVP
jgi:hypothetical protein